MPCNSVLIQSMLSAVCKTPVNMSDRQRAKSTEISIANAKRVGGKQH